jgi:glutamate-1-semialdehyde 2,1-aminomutase
VIPGGVNSGQRAIPGLEQRLVVTGAAGGTITTANGRQLIDFHLSFGPQILGHSDPDVDPELLGENSR